MSEEQHPIAVAQARRAATIDRFAVGLALKRAQHELRLAINTALAVLDTNISQLNVLAMIDDYPGISNADLARLAFHTPQTLGQQVIQLQGRGLIKRSPGEGRRIRHTLTAKGRKLLAAGNEIVREVDVKVMRDFSEADVATLLDGFHTIERRAAEVRADTRRFPRIVSGD